MSFERLLPIAREKEWGVDDIARETLCGAGCGLCRPYIREMLKTGKTVFTDILTE